MESTDSSDRFPAMLLVGNGKKRPHDRDGAKEKRTFRVTKASILDDVKDFLPRLAQANCDLETEMMKKPASSFDVEQVEEGKQAVEMNILVLPVDDEEKLSVNSEDEAQPKAKQLIVELSSDGSKPPNAKLA
ncbi:NOP protein chaperone 1-like [Oscarella lobularis]|uniref:NOP protein chaperone 1-like n=1 Tax=Oscarella lobularis TaxID=121494 RepID=UPI0033138CA4